MLLHKTKLERADGTPEVNKRPLYTLHREGSRMCTGNKTNNGETSYDKGVSPPGQAETYQQISNKSTGIQAKCPQPWSTLESDGCSAMSCLTSCRTGGVRVVGDVLTAITKPRTQEERKDQRIRNQICITVLASPISAQHNRWRN